MTHVVEKAILIALNAHAGTLDKSGQPYILHPLRVMLAQQNNLTRIAAVLHDVVEDTDVSLEDLHEAGLPREAIDAIQLLTHAEDTEYSQYIQRLMSNPIARAVKLADLRDNMDVLRLPAFTEHDLQRLSIIAE